MGSNLVQTRVRLIEVLRLSCGQSDLYEGCAWLFFPSSLTVSHRVPQVALTFNGESASHDHFAVRQKPSQKQKKDLQFEIFLNIIKMSWKL